MLSLPVMLQNISTTETTKYDCVFNLADGAQVVWVPIIAALSQLKMLKLVSTFVQHISALRSV